ncbi:MAG: hypothetical protein EOP84_10800 [Verrucomicrobiaceae bacterium]|nr:MAG: hypothetical protein EOP84_10800 [Verrucomicrobiaceae bacterium]
MPRYSDFIDRILLQPELLKKLCPTEPLDYSLVSRIREATDATLAGTAEADQSPAFRMVRGGLLYAVNALDPAHRIFQDEPSDLGSYWHGMMHRREADFDNARYWFRRAGRLPVFEKIHRAAAEHSALVARQTTWDPYLFTGECEQARFGAQEKTPELAAVQRAEWEVLFDYCWREAMGR